MAFGSWDILWGLHFVGVTDLALDTIVYSSERLLYPNLGEINKHQRYRLRTSKHREVVPSSVLVCGAERHPRSDLHRDCDCDYTSQLPASSYLHCHKKQTCHGLSHGLLAAQLKKKQHRKSEQPRTNQTQTTIKPLEHPKMPAATLILKRAIFSGPVRISGALILSCKYIEN